MANVEARELTGSETTHLMATMRATPGPPTGVFVDNRLVAVIHPYRDPETVLDALRTTSPNAR